MKKIAINNLLFKVVSVVLAVLLWFYVNHQENPVAEQVLTVPLEIRGLEQNLTVSDRPTYVKVRIQGQRKLLDTVTARDIQAFLEMSGVDMGQHIAEVHVTVPEKTQLVSVNPSTVNLNVEVLTTAQFVVNVSYSDNTPAVGYMALKPVLTPTQVLLSGPEDKLKEVDQVYVEVNLGEYNFNYHQKLPIKVEDKKGNLLLDWITLTPSEADVLVPVVHELPSKTVPVKVPLVGTPAEGYELTRVVAEPEFLTVLGETNLIDKVDSISTVPLNIAQASKDVVEELAVVVPEGLTLNRESKVTAVVTVERTVEKSFTGLPVLTRNAPQGLTAELPSPTVDVTVKGRESLIQKMMSADVDVYVDLASYEAGEHQVPVQIELPSGISLVEKKPAQISVVLKKSE
ncbi:YbbR-like domain-containing protein [Candidatus Formimonas warabiya]|uniref:YbbR-like domain-containing protein n=1 Tax=Formimonas warabiya TaxID=1761012 RepID=A0A3G1KS17_FORW1|nr:CdaR family protein [Candidatus Formimonas warabiya]ATW25251.1 hypothetical protein DCMF_11160 [Candidatus Formimonas warabiya]